MDTSETYIKMCKEATEIQTQKPEGSQGEFVYYDTDGFAGQECDDVPLTPFLWLLRQDQLQEMIGSFEDCLNLIDRWDAENALGYDYPDVTSMEQLWIALVMEEKYNKVWNGDNWIVIK